MTELQNIQTNEVTSTQATVSPQSNQQAISGDSSVLELQLNSADGFTSKSNATEYDDNMVQMNIVMDGGASNTRGLPVGQDGKIQLRAITAIESRYAIVPLTEQFNMHKITDSSIEENGEFIITERPDSPYIGDSYFENGVKVLKGTLIARANKAPSYIDNQGDKTNDIGLFINVLTSIAVLGLNARKANLKTRISLSVPPKERYMSAERMERFKRKLAGIYEVEMPRFNYTATINLDTQDINVEAEGELAYVFYITLNPNRKQLVEELRDEVVVVQDLGKSTFNLSALKNNKPHGPSHTVKTGGDNLTAKLYLILSRELDNPITQEQAQKAVETGYVKDGIGHIPVGKFITQAKEEIAESLYNEFVNYLQIMTMNFNQIHTVLFVGRGMNTTGEVVDGVASDNYSPSIAEILTSMYLERSPHTRYEIVQNSGLANLLGNASLMRAQWYNK